MRKLSMMAVAVAAAQVSFGGLKAGVNVIEVMADNAEPGPAGFVATVRWPFGLLLTDAVRLEHVGGEAVPPGESEDRCGGIDFAKRL